MTVQSSNMDGSFYCLLINDTCSCSTLKRFFKNHNLRRHDDVTAQDVIKAVEVRYVYMLS